MANNFRVKKGDQWVDEANFFDCKMWGKIAESLQPYMTKGKAVTVSGEIRQERWEKDGQNKSKVVLIVDKIKLESSQGSQSNSHSDSHSQSNYSNNSYQEPVQSEQFFDDVPF